MTWQHEQGGATYAVPLDVQGDPEAFASLRRSLPALDHYGVNYPIPDEVRDSEEEFRAWIRTLPVVVAGVEFAVPMPAQADGATYRAWLTQLRLEAAQKGATR